MDIIYVQESDLVPVSTVCRELGIDKDKFDDYILPLQIWHIRQYYASVVNNR